MDAAAASSAPGLWAGIRCFFGGIGWLATNPSAWALALVPVGCALVLMLLLGTASVTFIPDWIQQWLQPDQASRAAQWGAGALAVLGAILGVVLAALLGLALAQPLSGPALEALVRKREQALGAPKRAPTHFLIDVLRSLQSLLLGYAVGLPALLILFVISLLLPAAAIITVPCKMLVVAMTVAWDICDYPLSVRGLPVRERVKVLSRYATAVLGFSSGLVVAALLPCGALLLLPAGVAGATQLLHEIDRHEAQLPTDQQLL